MEQKLWNHQIKAVIFDNDGVILNTLPLYHKSLRQFTDLPFDKDLLDLTNGRSDIECAGIYVKAFGLDMTPEEFVAKRASILRGLFPEAPLIPGVDRVIRRIHAMGIPMAVATSSMRELHEVKVQNYRDLYDLFDVTICGNEVSKAKPSPEIFLTAAKKLGDFKPENVLVFEDAFNGIMAANSAGMCCTFLRSDITDREKVFREKGIDPTYLITEFSEFDFDKFIW